MNDFIKKHFILFDTIKWVLLGILILILLIKYNLLLLDNFEFLAIAEIYFTLWWFLLSIFTLIFAFKDWKRLWRLQKSSQYKEVFNIFFDAIIWHMLFAITFLISNYINIWNNSIFLIIFYVSVSILWIKIYRCIRIIKEIALLTINNKS